MFVVWGIVLWFMGQLTMLLAVVLAAAAVVTFLLTMVSGYLATLLFAQINKPTPEPRVIEQRDPSLAEERERASARAHEQRFFHDYISLMMGEAGCEELSSSDEAKRLHAVAFAERMSRGAAEAVAPPTLPSSLT